MMNYIQIDEPYLLLICNALLAAAAVMAILRFQRRTQQVAAGLTQVAVDEGATREQDLRETNEKLQAQIDGLTTKVAQLERHNTPIQLRSTQSLPVENAAQMARCGASIGEIAKSCGLNLGEARLMKQLHSTDREHAAQ